MKNEQVKDNLQKLFDENYNIIKNSSCEEMFDMLINENPKIFNIDLTDTTNLFNEDEIKNFKKAKRNKELASSFEKIKNLDFDEEFIKDSFKRDIKSSLEEIKIKVKSEKKGFKNQIIFLEYDYEPYAYFCGFGQGKYPILDTSQYFDFNYQEELYNGDGKIDYSVAWKGLLHFNEILEEVVEDEFSVYDSEIYQSLLNIVIYKTYLLLHEVFNELKIDIFKGIDIAKPLYIYGNEHDCEAINIYIFE